jgi:heptaprenyl diphosphate synthase
MKSRDVARGGLLLALTLILSYVERLAPLPVPVPGVKIGLPNLVVIFLLYRVGLRQAITVSLARVALAGLLFGTGVSVLYAAAGAVLSLTVMTVLKKTGVFSIRGVSVAGAVCHNFGQILVAMPLLENQYILGYFPVLCVTGAIAGVVIGLVAALLVEHIKKI